MFAMISWGDLFVVALAVAIVTTFFVTARRFIRRAELAESSEDPVTGEKAP